MSPSRPIRSLRPRTSRPRARRSSHSAHRSSNILPTTKLAKALSRSLLSDGQGELAADREGHQESLHGQRDAHLRHAQELTTNRFVFRREIKLAPRDTVF